MPNKLVKLRPVSASTATSPDFPQKSTQPVNGLVDGAGLAVDASGNLYVSDAASHVIYKIRPGLTSQIFAGAYNSSGNTDGQGGAAKFNTPGAIAIDPSGVLWVMDVGNNLIRRIDQNGNVFTVAQIPALTGGDTPGQMAVNASGTVYYLDGQ